VIIPATNETDLDAIPDEVREVVEFVPVSHVDQVWETVFPEAF
jgi:ATP-dependent Lon protease